jgi:hypothetical protein
VKFLKKFWARLTGGSVPIDSTGAGLDFASVTPLKYFNFEDEGRPRH